MRLSAQGDREIMPNILILIVHFSSRCPIIEMAINLFIVCIDHKLQKKKIKRFGHCETFIGNNHSYYCFKNNTFFCVEQTSVMVLFFVRYYHEKVNTNGLEE